MSSSSFVSITEEFSLSTLQRAVDENPALIALPPPDNADDSVGGGADASDADLHSILPTPPPPSLPPPPPPSPPPAPLEEFAGSDVAPAIGFDYVGERVLTAEDAGVITPPSSVDLLHRLALECTIPKAPLRQSGLWRAVVRECELMIFENRPPRPPTNTRDLRKLLILYDDFALQHRPAVAGVESADEAALDPEFIKLNRSHQIALFVARMKLLYAIRVSFPNETNASKLALFDNDGDYYWTRAAHDVDDRTLAVWLRETAACHNSLIGDLSAPSGNLLIHQCSLEALWQTMLILMRVWPRLPMCAELVRFFDELRLRVAYFMSYRERAPDVFVSAPGDDEDDEPRTVEEKMAQYSERVMGLNLQLFGLLDLGSLLRTESVRQRRGGVDDDGALIDNWDLATATRNDVGEMFAHVNMDFVDECERALHAMQVQLRSHAGFRHDAMPRKCIACDDSLHITDDAVRRLQLLIEEQLASGFRATIEEQFREQLYDWYVEPSELEQFSEYHPQDVHNALGCISKRRNADFRVLGTRFIEPTAYAVWREGGLAAQLDEPAHHLLVELVIDFLLRQDAGGARFDDYYIVTSLLEPWPFIPMALQRTRVLLFEVYESLKTTGTLRFRYQLMQRDGAEADTKHMDYQHPLVVRLMNSHAVLYNGHLHECDSLEHAILLWLLLFCLDPHLGGHLPTGAALQPFAQRLMPEYDAQLRHSLQRAEERIHRWNPMGRVVTAEDVDARLAMHDRMTHF